MTRVVAPPIIEQRPRPNKEAEADLLGMVLRDPPLLSELSPRLEAEHFFDDKHRRIYSAMLECGKRGVRPDPIGVADALGNSIVNVGGEYLALLREDSLTSAGWEHRVEKISQAALMRDLFYIASDLQRAVARQEGDPLDILAKHESRLLSIKACKQASEPTSVATIFCKVIEGIEHRRKHGKGIGHKTGFYDLDAILGGLEPSSIYILAARPGEGKTSLAMNIATFVAKSAPVLFASLEMSEEQLTERLMASASGVDCHRLRSGLITQDEIDKVIRSSCELPSGLFIYDVSSPTIAELLAITRRFAMQRPLGLIVVDYLQLIRSEEKGVNRNEQIGGIMRGVKSLVKQLKCPMLLLSQLNRGIEHRADPTPQLSDLRESGCLAGETLVYKPDDGSYIPIAELAKEDIQLGAVVSTKDSRMIRDTHVRAFSTGIKPVWLLTTGSGRTIRATSNHRLLCKRGWVRLDELVSDLDTIAVPAVLPGPQAKTMSVESLALLGHLIGNGCVLARHVIQYTTADYDLAELVCGLTTETFKTQSPIVTPRISQERNWFQVYLSAKGLTHNKRNPIASWFDELGIWNRRSYEKKVPDCVFKQDDSLVSCFLRHLFTTDGCATRTKRQTRGMGKVKQRPITDLTSITYSTSSEELSGHIQSLLLRVGVASRVCRVAQKLSDRPNYQLTVLGLEGKRRFCESVGFVGKRKTDTASNVKTVLDSAGEGKTLDGDIYWDRVASITPAGECEVFDLTVPVTSNFVANNIVVHNSIEQDADVVAFIGQPLWDASGDPPGNLRGLHVVKNRNGETGVVNLVFNRALTKFENYAQDIGPWTGEKDF